MSLEKWFKNKIESYKYDIDFLTEEVILDFTEKIVNKMEQLNINRTELAQKIGVSRAFITKLLNGNPNLTIKSMVSIAKSLGCKINIGLSHYGEYELKDPYTKLLSHEKYLIEFHKLRNHSFEEYKQIKNTELSKDEDNNAIAA